MVQGSGEPFSSLSSGLAFHYSAGKSKIPWGRTPSMAPQGSWEDVEVTVSKQVNVISSCDAAVQNVLTMHRRSHGLGLFLCTTARGNHGNALSRFQVHTSKEMLTGWKGFRERYMSSLRSGKLYGRRLKTQWNSSV